MRNVLSLPKGSSSSIAGFDIRLQTPNIILRGGPEEAAGALVMGTLVLKTSSVFSVKGITLVLEGVRRLRWQDCTGSPSTHKLHRGQEVIFTHTWNFLPNVKSTFDLSAGTHEYPFERVLPGNLIESLEGNPRIGVSYNLKAVIARPAFYSDVCVNKPLRVVRTLLPSALELSQTMAIENIWPGKVEYLIETPRKAVAFGSYTPIEVYLSPLLKGLVPAKTSVTLEELVTITVDGKKLADKRDILTKVYLPTQYQVASTDDENDGRWCLKENFELPRALKTCVQDADNSCVKIRHKLRIVVQLQNPDGHLSELRACLPIYLYISPNFMLQEDGVIASNDLPPSIETQEAPPSYELRVFDAMIDEESQCITPALTSAVSSAAPSPHVSATNLSETRPGSAIDYFSLNGHARAMLTPQSGAQSPRDLREVALANLSRVPSYESALRSGPPSPAIIPLPTYADFARVMGGTDRIQEDIPFPEPIRPVTVRHLSTQTRFKHNANHRPVATATSVPAYGH